MRWQKNNSFVNFGLQSWLATVCKCVVLWAGFPFSLCGGRKKQNKFPSNCTALSTEHQSNQSVFCNYFNLFYCINVSYRFYTCIQRSSISVVRVFGAIHCPLARTLIDAKIPNFSHFARITLIQCWR